MASGSGSRLTPFDVGQIKAHVEHGLGPSAIAKRIFRPGGGHFSNHAIGDAIAKLQQHPTWRGERQRGSGRPRKTTKVVDNQIYRQVLKNRGRHRVSVSFLKKILPGLRRCSDSLVEERLWDAGLRYLRRRRKTLVPAQYKQDRLAYCSWIMSKRQKTLNQFAYSDGAVFYLDRTAAELLYS